MAELLRRTPPILIYATISAGLLAVVVARALDTYQNFFAAAFALSHSNGSILVMANTAFLMLYLFGRALQAMFFGTLRPVEIERLYQRGGFFVTDFMLAFATFREAFGISSGVMVSVLLFVKCFHWLLSDRIEAMDQLPYPGPSRLEHARLLALLLVLWVCDSILLTYSLDAVMQQGIGLVVLFAAEYAILMVNLTQSLLKYILSVTEIRRAHRVGGAIAPPWEDKPIYGFYIELSTAFVELTIYLTYFAIMSIYHSIPIYAIRDVYVAGSLFITRSIAFVRYKRAMQALDVFDTPTQQELDSKSDKTCIVCREELNAIPAEGAPPATPASPSAEPDTSNGPPKRLPCGHIFHRNCLRSWFERQLTCPTCRQRVDDKLARANADAARAGAGAGGNNHGGDAALQQQPGVPGGGAQVNNRRAAANAVNRAQTTEIAQGQMREPLRFEGFYLQAGAFVPWVGGPLLARDPTQPNVPHRHTPVTQRARHPATGAHLPMPPPSVSGPPTAAIQSPPIATTTPPSSFVWPPSTPAPGPSTQSGEKPPSEAKPKVAEDDDDDDDDSDSDISVELTLSAEERRRIIAEAALQRTGSTAYQRVMNPASGLSPTPTPPTTTTPSTSTPAPTSTATATSVLSTGAIDPTPTRTPTEREKAYGKYFTMPTESSAMPTDSTQVTPSAKPMSFLAPRHSIASAPLSGEYNVRHDAPSFVPLFHSFHLPHYSAAVGPSRPWPLQKASLPTQTLSLPGQTTPQASVHVVPPLQTHANALNAMRTAPYPLRVTPQSPSSLQLQHHHPSMPPRSDSLFSRSNVKRESSPSQELTIQQIEVITRIQVEERLRILENVKRMTQQCIDELMVVKGTMPHLEALRQRAEENKPVVEPQSIFAAETLRSSVGPLEQVSSTSTLTLKSLGPLLADVKPIVEPEIVLAAEAPTVQPVLSALPASNIMIVDPLSLSVTEESTEVDTPIKQEEAPTLLEPEAVPREGTGEVPLVEGDSAESVL